jgi:hypothetical protein
MTLTELQDEVYTITKRPDLIAETLLAVRQATLALHQSDYFWKDLAETGLSFPASAYLQEIEYRSILPRFRAIKYLRKSDSAGATGAFFDVITPEAVLDLYGTDRTNVCYAAGASIEIKSNTQIQYVILGYYQNPVVTVSGYDSWIALDHPYAIVLEAAEKVFKMIGKTEEFAAFKFLRDEERSRLMLSNIQAVGY